MLNFGPSSLFFTSDNIDSWGEGIYGVYKEWSNKWIKRLLKAPVLNKCVKYFCPCDDVTLWAKLFVYKQQFVKFRPDL